LYLTAFGWIAVCNVLGYHAAKAMVYVMMG